MKTFTKVLMSENTKANAKDIINKASYRASTNSYSKDALLTRLGFILLSDSEISKLGVDYEYFSNATGKDLGTINLPKYITQNHVTKDYVYTIIDKKNNNPIKVMKYKNDYVVLDGHHRLAAAKALNQKKIKAVLIE